MAKAVVNTQQIFKAKVLEVKHLGTEMAAENVVNRSNKSSRGRESTVMVSGLPEGSTENSVHIHFQKKKYGGGDIEKVEMSGEGKTIVTFEDPQVGFPVLAIYYYDVCIYSVPFFV